MYLCILTTANAFDNRLIISNVTDTKMTISWVTENNCIGKICLSDATQSLVKTCYDDRGESFVGDTHYITISGLKRNTDYFFSIVSGEEMEDNNGQQYQVTTGNSVIPMGSFQPAGQIFLRDRTTVATHAIVYIVISNETEQSAPISTLVDQSGFWFVELVNARQNNNEQLFRVTSSDILHVSVEGGVKGKYSVEYIARDNNGGKDLYPPIILE